LVVAVAHREFREAGFPGLRQLVLAGGVLMDVKALFDPEPWREAGVHVWRL
jgi:hypothetical protein